MMALISPVLGEGNTISVGNSANPNLFSGNIEAEFKISNVDLFTGNQNTINQQNQKDINNYGTGTIAQNQQFYRLVTGDYNTLNQINYALAENWGIDSIITQTQEYFAAIVGDSNCIDQVNRATASITIGEGNFITQSQNNSAIQTGNNNYIDQENVASAKISGYYNIIDQAQINSAVQTGNGNTLHQLNELQNAEYRIGAYTETINGTDYFYDSWHYENPVDGASISGDWSRITQTQSNFAVQVGNGNNMVQENEAQADVMGLRNYASQEQNNTATQEGNNSQIKQNNSLVNRNLENNQSSGTYGNYSYLWSGVLDSPVPGAQLFGQNNSLTQAQRNSILVVGSENSADQKNYGYSQIADNESCSNTINQDQNNSAAQTGDQNTIFQSNNLVRRAYEYETDGYWSRSRDYPLPGAMIASSYVNPDDISSSDFNGIHQSLSNSATQVGTLNMAHQHNNASAVHSNLDFSVAHSNIEQILSNDVIEVSNSVEVPIAGGDANSHTQSNFAETQNRGDINFVQQTERNLAAITGVGETTGQSNFQYAHPDEASSEVSGYNLSEDGLDMIDQEAINDLVMTGSHDRSLQINSQYAFQEIYTDTYLNQTSANHNVITS